MFYCKISAVTFLAFSLLIVDCWKKQSHDIATPEIPNYVISGQVVDTDTQQHLPAIQVRLQAAYQLYECDITEFTVISDSLGQFHVDYICPGFYNILVWRDSVLTTQFRFELKHGDTTLVLSTPAVIRARRMFADLDLSGIAWRIPVSLAFISKWVPPFARDNNLIRIFQGSVATGFRALGTSVFPTENLEMQGLVWVDSSYYSFGGGLRILQSIF